MPRPNRLLYAGASYHVFTRGNDKQDIFQDDGDRRRMLVFLDMARDRFDCRYYAYCLMSNHFHLALRTKEANLDKAMGWLKRTYTVAYNERYGRTGVLFGGRYKAKLVNGDAYLLGLVRYLHNNPVKARICSAPESYRWSSARAYAGIERGKSLAACEEILSILSDDPIRARALFLELQAQTLPAEMERQFESLRGRFVGGHPDTPASEDGDPADEPLQDVEEFV